MVAPVIFLPESRQVLTQHGRLHVVNLKTASRDLRYIKAWVKLKKQVKMQ